MDDPVEDGLQGDSAAPGESKPSSRKRSREAVSSRAIPYGSDELSSFFEEDYDMSWEINHTVTRPPI